VIRHSKEQLNNKQNKKDSNPMVDSSKGFNIVPIAATIANRLLWYSCWESLKRHTMMPTDSTAVNNNAAETTSEINILKSAMSTTFKGDVAVLDVHR